MDGLKGKYIQHSLKLHIYFTISLVNKSFSLANSRKRSPWRLMEIDKMDDVMVTTKLHGEALLPLYEETLRPQHNTTQKTLSCPFWPIWVVVSSSTPSQL